jgi:uncharacterized protein YcnI
MKRTLSRLLVSIGGAVALVALGAQPAAAHVTVNPREVPGGGFATLTFRMPNEHDNARTTKLEVTLPSEQPLTSVSVRPHPGWTYQIQKAKLDTPIEAFGEQITEVVRTIIWTAQGPNFAVKQNEFEEFDVSVGRLPDSGQMVFRAIQTYDSGEVVRWIEQAAEGAPEPELPAPVLKLIPASQDQTPAAGSHTDETEQSTLPLVLSGLAVLISAGGLTTGLLALRRARRTTSP